VSTNAYVANLINAERICLREVLPAEPQLLAEGTHRGAYAWAEGYPVEGTLVASRMLLKQIHLQQRRSGFGMYQIIRRRDTTIIGDIGFHGAPNADGQVVVGFGLAPSARGQGYAAEALVALTRWALMQPDVRVVLADTTHDNAASQAVLSRAGFRHVRDDTELRYYEARRDSDSPVAAMALRAARPAR
jgi:RimJ/RimL family protein N-acetyltransferase